jgi:hypothetical protein
VGENSRVNSFLFARFSYPEVDVADVSVSVSAQRKMARGMERLERETNARPRGSRRCSCPAAGETRVARKQWRVSGEVQDRAPDVIGIKKNPTAQT